MKAKLVSMLSSNFPTVMLTPETEDEVIILALLADRKTVFVAEQSRDVDSEHTIAEHRIGLFPDGMWVAKQSKGPA